MPYSVVMEWVVSMTFLLFCPVQVMVEFPSVICSFLLSIASANFSDCKYVFQFMFYMLF